jgi:hypothetical protein
MRHCGGTDTIFPRGEESSHPQHASGGRRGGAGWGSSVGVLCGHMVRAEHKERGRMDLFLNLTHQLQFGSSEGLPSTLPHPPACQL